MRIKKAPLRIAQEHLLFCTRWHPSRTFRESGGGGGRHPASGLPFFERDLPATIDVLCGIGGLSVDQTCLCPEPSDEIRHRISHSSRGLSVRPVFHTGAHH
jgi:hypothetical protein